MHTAYEHCFCLEIKNTKKNISLENIIDVFNSLEYHIVLLTILSEYYYFTIIQYKYIIVFLRDN